MALRAFVNDNISTDREGWTVMQKPGIGLVGLGTMGGALALNIAERGFPIAVWNRTAAVTAEFKSGAGELAARIVPTETLEGLAAAMAAVGT